MSAALSSVGDLQAALSRLERTGALAKPEMVAALQRATVGDVNLLRAERLGEAPLLLASVARAGSGCQLHAAVLALDPAILTLSVEDGSGPLDRLLDAADDALAPALLALQDRLGAAASALSVAAARLELQARFVDAMLDEDGGGAPAPIEQLDGNTAREAALAIGALLSGKPLAIVSTNRRALDTLFDSMVSGGKTA